MTYLIILSCVAVFFFCSLVYGLAFFGIFGTFLQGIVRFPTIVLTALACSIHGLEIMPPKRLRPEENHDENIASDCNQDKYEEQNSDNKRTWFWQNRGDSPVGFLKRLSPKFVSQISPIEIDQCVNTGQRRETTEEFKARRRES